MKKHVFVICNLLLLSMVISAQDTVRIMTYNLYSGGLANMEKIANYIQNTDVDIAALQEVDLCTNRPECPNEHGKNQMAELGYWTKMLSVFGSTGIHYSGGYYGNGILSKYPITKVDNLSLPQVVDKKEPRSMMVVEWNINGKKLTIVNTHLSLDKNNRRVQLKYIRNYLRSVSGVKIVCGDLNSDPSEGLVPEIFKNWIDLLPDGQKTFSNWNPIYKYDWMLTPKKNQIQLLNAKIDLNKLSDHLPCYIDIVF